MRLSGAFVRGIIAYEWTRNTPNWQAGKETSVLSNSESFINIKTLHKIK
jgi:hypothetical protein